MNENSNDSNQPRRKLSEQWHSRREHDDSAPQGVSGMARKRIPKQECKESGVLKTPKIEEEDKHQILDQVSKTQQRKLSEQSNEETKRLQRRGRSLKR